MKLTTNESPIERIIRIVLGIGLAGLALAGGVTAPLVVRRLARRGGPGRHGYRWLLPALRGAARQHQASRSLTERTRGCHKRGR